MNPFGILNQQPNPWDDPFKMDPSKVPLGLLSQGLMQPQMAQQDMPAPGAQPAGPAQLPQTPPQQPSWSPQNDLNQVGQGMPQGAQQAPQGQGGGFFDKLGTVAGGLYGQGGPGDALITLGAGLASKDGWANGLMRANALNQQQGQTRQKQEALNQTAKIYAQRAGIPVEQAQAMAQAGGSAAMFQQLFKAPAQPQLVDVRGPDGSVTQKWMRPGEADGIAVGAAKPAETVRTITDPEQRKQLGVPAEYTGPVQVDASGKLMLPGKATTEVNVNGGEDEFKKKLGGTQAEFFSTTAADAVNAKGDLGRVQMLRSQIDKLPGGFFGGAQALANQYGIKLGPNQGNLEAANAIISQLIPTQRVPGSGTTSDRDLELFKSSLPKLSNTKEGNALIMDTMEGMAKYKMAQGEIATKVITGEMSRAEGIRAIQALPDPFENLKKSIGGQGGEAAPVKAPTWRIVP